MFRSPCFFLALLTVTTAVSAVEYYVIPHVAQNAIAVDADLSDWQAVPHAIERYGRESVTFRPADWKDETDLGATMHIAWSEQGLFVAAQVTDDQIPSRHTGRMARFGDHVAVWLDMMPMFNPPPTPDQGQVYFVISPGRFDVEDHPPTIYIHRPEGDPHVGRVAARRTEGGYIVEAFVPFARLGIDAVSVGNDANLELAVCDTDDPWREVRTMLTIGREPFRSSRDRLIPVVFGDNLGHGELPLRVVPLAESAAVSPSATVDFAAAVARIPSGRRAQLSFQARMPATRASGYRTNALGLKINGQTLTAAELLNKPVNSTMADGRALVYIDNNHRMTMAFAPDFRATDASPSYADAHGHPTCRWTFDVTPLLNTGNNTVTFLNHVAADAEIDRRIILSEVEIRFVPEP